MSDERWLELVCRCTAWTQNEQLEVETEAYRAREFGNIQHTIAPADMDAIHMEANLADAQRDGNRARMIIARMRSWLGGDADCSPIDLARQVNAELRVAQEEVAKQAERIAALGAELSEARIARDDAQRKLEIRKRWDVQAEACLASIAEAVQLGSEKPIRAFPTDGPEFAHLVGVVRSNVDGRKDALSDNAALQRWISEHGHRIGTMSCPHDGGYACEPGCVAYSIATASHPGAALLTSVHEKDETIKALCEHIAKHSGHEEHCRGW